MKQILILTLSCLSILVHAQCVDCRQLEEALKEPEKVKTLKFNAGREGVYIEDLSDDIGLLVNAEIIYLSDHPFTSVPSSIAKLKKLKELSFAGCELTKLPEEIFTMAHLKELILLNNDFSEEYKTEIKARFKKEMPKTMVLIN